ncbi:hypothetical protein BKA70DRAFT_1307578 [Coprinopsis sp. MPI-PUGE-AT-0042]|nr:hypothetical protein BKA70DRAFT_1307578 [Coprinopsis sp. MPI-PUGE-AT-0042]
MKPKSPHSEDDESEEEDDFSMNLDIRGKAPKPTFDEQGRAVIGLRMAPSPTPKMSSVGGPSSSSHQLRSQNKSDASSIFNLDPKAVPEIAHLSFTLIRFSTGQLLEDDLTMSDYNINPHELLELHLSISPPSPDHVTATSFLPPTATFPFPLLAAPSQLLQGKSRKKRAQIEALVAPHVTRLVSLPRSVPQAYASPYWEGWIRILRLASRDDEEYLYTGLPVGSGNRRYKPGTPGHSQYGFGLALGDWTTSMPNMISEEKDVDLQLAKNFGMGSVGSGSSGYGHGVPASHSGAQIRTAKSKFEWRERWLIIREGWLFLLKERGDTRPSHAFPLANLVNLRDADQLTDSIENAKRRRPSRPAPARSPPRPPHARSPPRAGHVQSPPRSNTTRSAPTAPSVASSSTAQVEPSTSPPRQRHTSSRSQQGHPLFPDFPNPPATDDSSTHPKLRSEYIDPFAPSNVNRKLFVPKSKEEAEAAGMKIICTKFRQTSSEERKDQPDPFRGYDHDIQGLESTLAKQYSSFGPSMDDGSGVAAAVGGLVSGGFIDPLVERVLYENERDEKEERERGKKWEEEAAKARAKLKEKQSVPHSLQLFGNFEPTKTPSNIAERRPSLPQLNTKTSGSSLFNMTPSASIGSIPFSAIFKESRKKRKEEKVLRAKDKGKAKQRDTREAERLLEDFGAFGMTGGGRRKKGKGAERQVKSDGQIPEETFGDPFAAGSSRSVEPHAGVEIPPHVAAERQSPAESETESQMAEDERNYGEEDASTGDEDENKDNPENGAEELSKASSDTTHDHDTALALQIFEEGTLEEEPGSGSESLALSSPVFARAAGADEDDDSDLDSIPSRRRRYIYNTTDTRRSFTTSNLQLPTVPEPPPSTTDQPSTSSQANEVSVGSQSDPDQADEDRTKVTPTKAKIPKANPTSPRSSAASHKSGTASIATQSTVTQRKVLAGAKAKNLGSKGQWIIMDVGSDAAYHSLLRVLHRTIEEPLLSSFLQSLPSLFTATPAATPVAATNEQMFPPPSSSQVNNPSPSSSVRARSRSDPAQTLLQPPGSATAATFRDDTSPTLATPRPYESSALARTRKMLGTVPYPEWRLRTVNRARRASMGVIGQPLEALSMTMGHHPDGEFLRFDPTLVDQASIDPFVTKIPQSDRDSEGTGDDADDVHADQGFFGLDHDDYEKNGSDMEWQGWTADISRQVRVAKEAISKQSIPDQTSSPTISEFSSEDEPSDDEQVEFDMLPTSPAEERLLAVKRRFAMEPVGVVTSPTTSTELPSFVADVPGPKAKHHHNDEHRYHHLHKREMNTACMLVSRSLSNASSMDSVRRHPSTSSHAGHSTVPSAHDAPPASPPFEAATSSPSPLSQTFPATAPIHALKHSKSFKGDLQITSELWPTPHVARQPSMPSLGSSVRTMEQVFTLEPTENRVAIRQLTASDELSSGPSSRASPVIPSSVSPPYTPSPGSVSSPSSSNLHKQPSSNFQRQQSLHSSAAQEGSSSSQGPPPSPGTSPKSPRPRLTVATSPTSPQSHTGHLELRSPTRLTHLGLQPASVTSPQSTSQLGPESVASPKKKKSGAFERFVRGL